MLLTTFPYMPQLKHIGHKICAQFAYTVCVQGNILSNISRMMRAECNAICYLFHKIFIPYPQNGVWLEQYVPSQGGYYSVNSTLALCHFFWIFWFLSSWSKNYQWLFMGWIYALFLAQLWAVQWAKCIWHVTYSKASAPSKLGQTEVWVCITPDSSYGSVWSIVRCLYLLTYSLW